MKRIKEFFTSDMGRFLAGAVLFAFAIISGALELAVLSLVMYVIALAISGFTVYIDAVRGILRRDFLDEKFLMSIASIGAMIIGEYTEGVAVMLFFQIGEWFQSYAVGKSRRNISQLMDIRPDYANIEDENGNPYPGYEEFAESVYACLDHLLNEKKYTCLCSNCTR